MRVDDLKCCANCANLCSAWMNGRVQYLCDYSELEHTRNTQPEFICDLWNWDRRIASERTRL
jgi:hypothetical protein